jgi:hypothetical protein
MEYNPDIIIHFSAVLISNRYVVTIYQFQYYFTIKRLTSNAFETLNCRSSLMPYTVAYSGDLTNISRAQKHTILSVTDIDEKCSIVKLCPPVHGSSLVSLADEDNFNYLTNTTGKYVYMKADAQVNFIFIFHFDCQTFQS